MGVIEAGEEWGEEQDAQEHAPDEPEQPHGDYSHDKVIHGPPPYEMNGCGVM